MKKEQNNNIILLKPYLVEKIWGGNKLKNYNYDINPDDKIGESLIISALDDKSSTIRNENISGETLISFYEKNRDFFGNYEKPYPLLTKIIDANDDLSIQVHPDDKYAKKMYNSSGKNECWYILEAKKNASIIYGTNAKSIDELKTKIINNDWDNLFKEKKVQKGDFIYVPAGTIHAIKSGILVYELQQSCDITYRIFDYNRKGRELDIKNALKVIKLKNKKYKKNEHFLIKSNDFNLIKFENTSTITYNQPKKALWLEITVISGKGKIDEFNVIKGSSLLVRNKHNPVFKGKMTLMIAYIENKWYKK